MTRLSTSILLLVTTALTLLSTTALAAGAITSLGQFNKARQNDDRLRVIVELRAPKMRTLSAASAGDWVSLGDYIEQVQSQAINALGWRNINDLVRYKTIPAMAKHVNKREMRDLLAAGHVKAVYESIPIYASLQHTASQIGLPRASQQGNAGKGQVVAVLDTGIDGSHPFLTRRIIDEACFSLTGSCPNGKNSMLGKGAGQPCAGECSHGSHVAGIVAGSNGKMTGVAPHAELLAVQVFFPVGQTGAVRSDLSVVLQGMDWVLQQANRYAIAAINMSLGGGKERGYCDNKIPPMVALIDLLKQQGIATIIASGNDGFSDGISAPACLSNAISVGSLSKSNTVSKFSNSFRKLTIMAPGGSYENEFSPILSSVPGNQYQAYAGTSMAAPQVAGAWAVLKGTYPKADFDQIRQAITAGTRYRDPRNGLSFPTLNVAMALQQLKTITGGRREASPKPPPKRRANPPDPTPPAPKKPCSQRVGGILIESDEDDCNGKSW